LVSGGVLIILTLFLPITNESCGGPRTGLEFVRGAKATLPFLTQSEWADRGLYIFTLVFAAVAVLLVALSVPLPNLLRGRRLTKVLFGAAGVVSLFFLSKSVMMLLVLAPNFAKSSSPDVFIAGIGIVVLGLALRNGTVRASKLVTILLVLGCLDCLVLLSNFVVSLSLGTGFLPGSVQPWLLLFPESLYWFVPAYLWLRFGLNGEPQMQESWATLRAGIVKLYLPCILGMPLIFWLCLSFKVWGFIPYTLGIHLLSLGYMQLERSTREGLV
jgi:hypothetical protein